MTAFPYRPYHHDDEQPTTPGAWEASHPHEQRPSYGQRARPTQRPALHIDEMPTQVIVPAEVLKQVRAQRQTMIGYHRSETQRLRGEASWLNDVEIAGREHQLTLHEQELAAMDTWPAESFKPWERKRYANLMGWAFGLRTELAPLRLRRMELIERARGHEEAIRRLEAEMAAEG